MIGRWTKILLLTLLGLSGCIDPIEFELDQSTPQLVIDGYISNEPGPYFIRLSTSSTETISSTNAISGATVTITDNTGITSTLIELVPGQYETIGLRGEAGKSYQLKVVLATGEEFESSFQEIPEPVEIDSLYFASVSKLAIATQGSTVTRRGVEFFVDVKNDNNATSFYRWDFVSTYQVATPFPAGAAPTVCWVTEEPSAFLNIAESASFGGSKLSNHPIFFVTNSLRTSIKYSMLLKQMAMDEATYNFWEGIKNLREDNGTIFDPPPARINGNIFSTADPSQTVLGFFAAYGISEKRIFVSREQIDGNFPQLNQECIVIPPMIPPAFCSDCRAFPNSTAFIPPFWE